MNYVIDSGKDIPAYMQLYALLRSDITTGAYGWNRRLPSKRTLAAETGLSVITVEHALSLLCEEGYAEARERSGVYVTYREADFQSTPQSGGAVPAEPVPSAPGRHPGDFPYSVLAKTMRRVLLDYGERILVKSPNHGCPELIAEIAAYLARSRGIHVKPSQIVVGSGAEYLYGLIAQLLGRERTVALEKPSYEKIHLVYRANGLTCDFLTMGTDGILASELQRTTASVLHVTPFHSYPSGVTASISRKMAYLAWVRSRGGYIVEDNFDSELTVSQKPEEPLFSMTQDDNVIYLNTFSKTIAPSMRIGYLLLPSPLAAEFDQRLGFYSCTVPVFEQYVLAELLKTGDFERNINRIRRKRRKMNL